MTIQLRTTAEDLVRFSAQPVSPVIEPTAKGGIAHGTLVDTQAGPVQVEDLRAGDMVKTREYGAVPVLTIEDVTAQTFVIRTDSLGLARPARDIIVAGDQHLTLRDWRAEALFDAGTALVPANRLVDGTQINTAGVANVVRLDLGAPMTIYANGLEMPTGRVEAGVVDVTDVD